MITVMNLGIMKNMTTMTTKNLKVTSEELKQLIEIKSKLAQLCENWASKNLEEWQHYYGFDVINNTVIHIYNIEYYYSIKSGTSNFDTFNRNDISGQKVKCIEETKFCNKRFHYKVIK